jgi:hypothetical protein
VCHTYREPSGSGATDGTTGLADRVEPVPNQIPTRRSISSRDADLSSTMSGTCGHTAAQMSVIAQSEWSCLFDRLADLDCRPLGVRHRMAAVKRHVTTRAAPRTQERGAGIEPASAAWCAAVLTVGLSPQPCRVYSGRSLGLHKRAASRETGLRVLAAVTDDPASSPLRRIRARVRGVVAP